MIYAGIAITTGSRWAFVSLVSALLAVEYRAIRREERYLERRFGPAHTATRGSDHTITRIFDTARERFTHPPLLPTSVRPRG